MFAFPVSEMVGGIFYEHGHRMMATFVGFITLMQAVLLGFSDQPKWIIKLGYISLILVTHDIPMALEICKRSIILNGGKITTDDETYMILKDRNAMEENRLELPFGFALHHLDE